MSLISTASFCGQVLSDKGYDGAAADVWSCGVILFVLMAGYLPFDEPNLMTLYKRVRVITSFSSSACYYFLVSSFIISSFAFNFRYARLNSTVHHGSRQVPRMSLSVFLIPAL